MSIKVLAHDVISKIAAGEVVERPASVVKELVENSLDAGATQITVEVNGGGIQLIRVTDNGMGIPSSEVALAFESHATSKITSEIDLEAVSSLGFRGEALPSIAAVAEVSLVTRHQDDSAGTAIKLENGTITSKAKQGCPQGTTVTIRNLFRNVPARLKFLKSASTENGHINHLVTQYSLAFPEVKFTLIIGGRTALRTPGNGNLRDVLVEVYGLETAQAMLEVGTGNKKQETSVSEEALVPGSLPLVPRISGFVSSSSLSRSNRNYLSFFVNRRWVQSRMLTYAVGEAYQGMLMTGKHPVVVINISLSSQEIDVNVHPTKSEIKFRRERDVFLAVQKAVRGTLVGFTPVPSMRAFPPPPLSSAPALPCPVSPMMGKSRLSPHLTHEHEPTQPIMQLPILRVIGQFQNTYIAAEGPHGMYLIDQHAAHERILFERVQDQQARRAIEVQGLLEPMTIEVTAQQGELLRSQGEILSEYGFSLEQFGERTYLLRSVPALLKRRELTQVLIEILDSLGGIQRVDWQESIAASLACHGAIRAGQTLSLQEMEELVHQLEQTHSPRTCPHGRPTMIHLSASQLEREFGRR